MEEEGLKKPYTQDNWLEVSYIRHSNVPVSFTVVSVELMPDNSQYLTEGEIEGAMSAISNLKFCEDSWPLK